MRCPNCNSPEYDVLSMSPFCILKCKKCGKTWDQEHGEEEKIHENEIKPMERARKPKQVAQSNKG